MNKHTLFRPLSLAVTALLALSTLVALPQSASAMTPAPGIVPKLRVVFVSANPALKDNLEIVATKEWMDQAVKETKEYLVSRTNHAITDISYSWNDIKPLVFPAGSTSLELTAANLFTDEIQSRYGSNVISLSSFFVFNRDSEILLIVANDAEFRTLTKKTASGYTYQRLSADLSNGGLVEINAKGGAQVLTHELFHAFGLDHANAVYCPSASALTADLAYEQGQCSSTMLDGTVADPHSILGAGKTELLPRNQLTAYQRSTLGLLEEGTGRTTITGFGSYNVTLNLLDPANSAKQELRIKDPASTAAEYSIEYRPPKYDSEPGVSVTRVDQLADSPTRQDPDSTIFFQFDKVGDALLTADSTRNTFKSASGALTVTVTQTTASQAKLSVQLQGTKKRAAASISVTPTQVSAEYQYTTLPVTISATGEVTCDEYYWVKLNSSNQLVISRNNAAAREATIVCSTPDADPVEIHVEQDGSTDPRGAINDIEARADGLWVRGWAADEDAPTTPIQVKVSIGGDLSKGEGHTLDAKLQRTDIPRTYPQFGENHGYNATLSTSKRGVQEVYFYAVNASGTGGADKLLGKRTVNLGSYGVLDNIESRTGGLWVRGWAADADAPTKAIQVKVSIGGVLGKGETHTLDAKLQRTDIPRTYPQFGENHGFNATVTTTKRGKQDVYVYAVNAAGTEGPSERLIAKRSLELGSDPQGGINSVEARPGGLWVRGWAADADAPTTPIKVKVSVGGTLGQGQTFTLDANLQRTDIPRTYPEFGEYHGYNKTLTTAKRGQVDVYIYATNAEGTGGADKLLGKRTITIAN
jgi:hypothetical protein